VEQLLKAAGSAVAEPTPPSGPSTATAPPREPGQPIKRGQQRDSGLFIP